MKNTYILDCKLMKEKKQAHEYLAEVLNFPGYYGKNLDALYDCLTDMKDCEIEIINSEALPENLKGILQVIKDAANAASFKVHMKKTMKIYIDFDDVICETAKYFTKIAKDLFDKDIPYREVQFFNLQKSFDLSDEQYDELMRAGHVPETLLSYEETPGASETINSWVEEGHEVYVITGRPFDAYEPSRRWLDEHNLSRVPLFCVDKYGRENFNQKCTYNLTLEKLYEMEFDLAVEDSPAAFEHVLKFNNCKVAVFNRPWNRNAELPNENFIRCENWKEIDELIKK